MDGGHDVACAGMYGMGAPPPRAQFFRNGTPLGGALRFALPRAHGTSTPYSAGGTAPLYPTVSARGNAQLMLNFGRQHMAPGFLPRSTLVRTLYHPMAPPPDIEVPAETPEEKKQRVLAEAKARSEAKRQAGSGRKGKGKKGGGGVGAGAKRSPKPTKGTRSSMR
jgi:hypothetical protein